MNRESLLDARYMHFVEHICIIRTYQEKMSLPRKEKLNDKKEAYLQRKREKAEEA